MRGANLDIASSWCVYQRKYINLLPLTWNMADKFYKVTRCKIYGSPFISMLSFTRNLFEESCVVFLFRFTASRRCRFSTRKLHTTWCPDWTWYPRGPLIVQPRPGLCDAAVGCSSSKEKRSKRVEAIVVRTIVNQLWSVTVAHCCARLYWHIGNVSLQNALSVSMVSCELCYHVKSHRIVQHK